MTLNENFELADVSKTGSVLMGKLLVCDGSSNEEDRTKAVFTHIHSDHIFGPNGAFNKALQRCQIFTTRETMQLLSQILNTSFERKRQYHTVSLEDPKWLVKGDEIPYDVIDVNDSRMIGDGKYKEKLTLLQSSHMLGACGVQLTTPDGITIGYSGDFSSDDKPPQCDILIIDATHGSPQFNKKNTDEESLERRLLDLVNTKFNTGKSVIIHAHRGKLQELMSLVSSSSEIPKSAKFFTDEINSRIVKVYNKYGFDIRDLSTDYEDKDFHLSTGNPFIEFTSGAKERDYEDKGLAYGINLMGYLGHADCTENESHATFQMSQHAQFDEIIEYVRNSGAKQIIVENTRTGLGLKLENNLREKGFNAVCRPEPIFVKNS